MEVFGCAPHAQRVMSMDRAEAIKTFILNDINITGVTDLSYDDELLNSGIVDSIGVIQLVTFLEEKLGSQIKPEDIIPSNFKSVRAITALIGNE
jgi:acyl carrier protein